MKRETRELIENMDAEIGELRQQIADMTEARDAAAARAKWLRDKCTAEECVLKMIDAYSNGNPGLAAKIAWAAVEDNATRTVWRRSSHV